jgi:RimJ/RimL family protein N-acetyltransferase
MSFTELATERLLIRQLRMEDAEPLLENRSAPEVLRWQPVERKTIEEVREFLAQLVNVEPDTPDTWLGLAIIRRDDRRLVGDIGARFPRKETWQCELGIGLGVPYHGQGYASEAMRALIGYLFETLDKHRVYASIDPRNHASVALVERLGFRREAYFKASIWWKGEWADDYIYAMLAEEWREHR